MKLAIMVMAFAVYTVGVSAVYAGGCSGAHAGSDDKKEIVTSTKKVSS